MADANNVLCLMGPTASGKTALALKLAESLPIDIISVDSAMVYRGMDIGTAKPERAVLDAVPHYLIDICDPRETYSVGDFYRDVQAQITKSIACDRIPLLVGGTMMYFRALQQGLAVLPQADTAIRAQILQDASQHGWTYLHDALMRIDPLAAGRIHCHDKQRIQRALEVYYISGKSITEHQTTTLQANHLSYKWFALFPQDRVSLHREIAARFHMMLEAGLVQEVAAFFNRGDISASSPSMRSVNYRQVWDYLAGNSTYDVMVDCAIAATRQLAKRQMTWLRSFPSVQLIENVHDFPNTCKFTLLG